MTAVGGTQGPDLGLNTRQEVCWLENRLRGNKDGKNDATVARMIRSQTER